MARNGLNLSFVSDVSGFLKGTRDVEGALDKVADSLDDLAREGQRAGEQAGDGLGDGVRDGGRDAERALEDVQATARTELGRVEDHARDAATDTSKSAEKMERSFREAFDAVKSESKKAGDDVADSTKRGFDKAKEGAGEFRDEANSTAREAAASFDGSADSIAGTFQEVAANAFAGFGPAGAAAGLAAAVGIGVMWSSFQADAEAAKARITEMAEAMIEANTRVVGADFINDQLKAIYTDAEGAAIKLDELRTAAEQTGVTESTLARAFAGDQDARVQALTVVQDAYAAASEDAVSLDNDVAASGVERMYELGRWKDELGGLGTDYDTASGKAAGYQAAISAAQTGAQRGVGETRKAYEDLNRTVNDIPDTKTVTIDADTSLAERRLASFRARLNQNDYVITADVRAQGGYEANRNSGGLVGGEGSDIEDRVRLNASPGEFVVDAQAVDQIGLGNLQQMNEGQRKAPTARPSAASTSPEAMARLIADAMSHLTLVDSNGSLLGEMDVRAGVAVGRRASRSRDVAQHHNLRQVRL